MGRFYNKQVWKRLRLQFLRAHPLCAEHLARGETVPATDVDHIVALPRGEALDPANLRALCHSCHSAKTRYIDQLGRERVPVKGCSADGRPLDAAHWWNE